MKHKNGSRMLGLLALGLVIATPPRVVRADDDAARTAIEANYAKLAEAYKTKDLMDGLAVQTAMEADDFTAKDKEGKTRTREEANAHQKEQLAQLKASGFAIKDFSMVVDELTMDGDKADVTSTTTVKGTIKDKDGKEQEVDDVSKSKEVWAKDGDVWKIHSVEAIAPAK